MTTIAISESTRDALKSFGNKGETYDEILERVLDWAGQMQLERILMDKTNTIPIEEALKRAKEKYGKK